MNANDQGYDSGCDGVQDDREVNLADWVPPRIQERYFVERREHCLKRLRHLLPLEVDILFNGNGRLWFEGMKNPDGTLALAPTPSILRLQTTMPLNELQSILDSLDTLPAPIHAMWKLARAKILSLLRPEKVRHRSYGMLAIVLDDCISQVKHDSDACTRALRQLERNPGEIRSWTAHRTLPARISRLYGIEDAVRYARLPFWKCLWRTQLKHLTPGVAATIDAMVDNSPDLVSQANHSNAATNKTAAEWKQLGEDVAAGLRVVVHLHGRPGRLGTMPHLHHRIRSFIDGLDNESL